MASITQSLHLRVSAFLPPQPKNPRTQLIRYKSNINFTNPRNNLSIRSPRVTLPVAASSSQSQTLSSQSSESPTLLTDSTRTIATLAILAHAVFKSVTHKLSIAILNPNPQFLEAAGSSLRTVGPAFFASLRDRPDGYLNTPLTVVAAGLCKWLDIYSGVLMVRVLLSWFPNIPWERQPLSAIRDLCDPYLNLFRNIVPPVFGALDVSPLLAFAVLGTLGSILNGVAR